MPISAQALDILLAHGFSENISKVALNAVGGSSITLALEWIEKHSDDPVINTWIDVEIIDMPADEY